MLILQMKTPRVNLLGSRTAKSEKAINSSPKGYYAPLLQEALNIDLTVWEMAQMAGSKRNLSVWL